MPPNDELINNLYKREIETLQIFLVSKALRTSLSIEEYINTRIRMGADPETLKSDLYKDLEEGGRIFGEFRSAVKATTNGTINRSRDNSLFGSIGIDTKYRWVAVMVNTCPDCLERHGKVKTWAEWEAEGLPRTGQTICKENCRCLLLPEATVEMEPIKREARK